MFLLASRFQAFALVAAYMVALPIKGLISLIFVRKHMKGIVTNWWQSLIAPLLAAGVIWALLRVFGNIFWVPDSGWRSVALLASGLIVALPPYFFLSGLFGAWDHNGLAEFRRAVPMSSVGRPLAALLLRCTEWGAGLSPLHDRFPTVTYAEAMVEADELTRLKVPLDNFSVEPAASKG